MEYSAEVSWIGCWCGTVGPTLLTRLLTCRWLSCWRGVFFSGDFSGGLVFPATFRQTSASSTRLVLTPILMIFIPLESSRRDASTGVIKIHIWGLSKNWNFSQRRKICVFKCSSLPELWYQFVVPTGFKLTNKTHKQEHKSLRGSPNRVHPREATNSI